MVMRFEMKKVLLSSVAGLALAAQAFAADLPRRSAPAPALVPVYSFTWSGFYIGGQLGYAWGTNRVSEPAVVGAAANASVNGFLGGGHVGANWQVNQLVFGVEGDIEYSGADGRVNVGAPFTAATGFGTDFNWQGSIRARFGFAADRALLYVTGGFAFANIDTLYLTPGLTTLSSTKTGYAVGAGIEYAFTQNWTGRAEYRYSDFGRISNTVGGVNYRNEVDQHAVRFGISYKW
jgi:outer membrane immunogenic protein